MTAANDPQEQFGRLLGLFAEPAELHFAGDPDLAIEFAFKHLDTSDAPSTTRLTMSSELGFLGRKMEYQDFADDRIEDAMAWPNEFITSEGRLDQREVSDEIKETYVNATRDQAIAWFRSLTERIASKAPSGVLLFGNPGTGKSTLLKYLIQRLRPHSSENGVIYSRFETSKFIKWKRADEPIHIQLIHYLHALALRDVILNDAGVTNADGKVAIRSRAKWFGSQHEIEAFLDKALEQPATLSQDDEHEAAQIMRDACLGDVFVPAHFFDAPLAFLPYALRVALGPRKLCFIFDGLDHLQPDDDQIERDKFWLFLFLMSQFHPDNSLGLTPLRQVFPSLASPIIVLRHQTYQDWKRQSYADGHAWTDIKRPDLDLRNVIAPHSAVALYKAIPRPGSRRGPPPASYFLTLKRVLESAEKVIIGGPRKRRREGALLDIFDGNLRDEFTFIRGVLAWLREDVVPAIGRPLPMREFMHELDKTDIAGEFERLRYRLFDLLLRFDQTTFENLICTFRPQAGQRRSWSRGDHHGFVDNVFNYNSDGPHHGDTSNHCLLMKVRILQYLKAVLEERESSDVDEPGVADPRASGAAIAQFLRRFSYSDSSLSNVEDAVMVLRYGGFLNERVNYGDHRVEYRFADRAYSITQKGLFAINVMIFNTGYLEHCFHCTLLPKLIHPNARNEPREHKILQWSINSIINYYVLLNYIRYIESNNPPDVLASYSIYDSMHAAILRSVGHMCRGDERRGVPINEAIISGALRELERLREQWRRNGVLRAS